MSRELQSALKEGLGITQGLSSMVRFVLLLAHFEFPARLGVAIPLPTSELGLC